MAHITYRDVSGVIKIGLAVFGLILLSGCSPTKPTLIVSPSTTLVDERLSLVVEGLDPGQPFTLRAVTYDQRDRPWEAESDFTAGPG